MNDPLDIPAFLRREDEPPERVAERRAAMARAKPLARTDPKPFGPVSCMVPKTKRVRLWRDKSLAVASMDVLHAAKNGADTFGQLAKRCPDLTAPELRSAIKSLIRAHRLDQAGRRYTPV